MIHRTLIMTLGFVAAIGVLMVSAEQAKACSLPPAIQSCKDAHQREAQLTQAIWDLKKKMKVVNTELRSNGDLFKCNQALLSQGNCIRRVKNKRLFEYVELRTGNTCQSLPSFRADFLCSEVADTNIAARRLKDRQVCEQKYQVRRNIIELRDDLKEAKAYIQKRCDMPPLPKPSVAAGFTSIK